MERKTPGSKNALEGKEYSSTMTGLAQILFEDSAKDLPELFLNDLFRYFIDIIDIILLSSM
jgi:hypothetical protein